MSKEKKKKISNEFQVQQQEQKEIKDNYYEGLDEWRRLEKWRPGRRNFA